MYKEELIVGAREEILSYIEEQGLTPISDAYESQFETQLTNIDLMGIVFYKEVRETVGHQKGYSIKALHVKVRGGL